MAITILPREEGLGALGRALGTGLGGAYEQHQKINDLAGMLGGGEEAYKQARGIAAMPSQGQGQALKQIQELMQFEAWKKADQARRGVMGQQGVVPGQPSSPMSGLEAIQQALSGAQAQPTQPMGAQAPTGGIGLDADLETAVMGRQVDYKHALALQEQRKAEKDKMSLAERKFASKEEVKDFAKYATKIEETEKKAAGAKDRYSDLKMQKDLIKSGTLSDPEKYKLAGWLFNTDETTMTQYIGNPSDQLLNAINLGAVTGAKDIFGTRVTEGEIRLLLNTLPSLLHLRETQEAIVELRMLSSKELIGKGHIQNTLLNKYGDKTPPAYGREFRAETYKLNKSIGEKKQDITKRLIDMAKKAPKSSRSKRAA